MRTHLLPLLVGVASTIAQTPSFTGDDTIDASEGHATIRWRAEHDGRTTPIYQLQYATDPDFTDARTWYEGPAEQSFVSGLEEGTHLYRVRTGTGDDWSPWSEPLTINVTHHPMWLAITLFASGSVLFLLLVAFVTWASRRPDDHERDHESDHA